MPTYDTYELTMRGIFGGIPFDGSAQNYGEERRIRKDEPGYIVEVRGVRYFVPQDASWTAGAGRIRLERAYRVFSEQGDSLTVREIKREKELINPAIGLVERITKILEAKGKPAQ